MIHFCQYGGADVWHISLVSPRHLIQPQPEDLSSAPGGFATLRLPAESAGASLAASPEALLAFGRAYAEE